MKKMARPSLILAFLVLSVFVFRAPRAFGKTGDTWVPVAMHMATTISDGSLSLDEILKAAEDEGVKVVIPTDRDFMKWEYGLWPLQHILRKTVESNSVFKYGFDKYLELIKLESSKYQNLIIIAGLESAPFYYWKGSPFRKDFRICDWHKHLLVVLPDDRDYRALPVFLNPKSETLLKNRCDIISLWPFATLILGFVIFLRRECSYKDMKGRELSRSSTRCRVIGLLVMAASFLFVINNYPFKRPAFDQYCPVAGAQPYQKLIDYVAQKKGAIFWAHPEACYVMRQGRVLIETYEATPDLWRTKGYTGFSVFHEGYEHVGKIGGDWDGLLKQYCLGQRSSPVWATAGIAFDQGSVGDLRKALRELRLDVLSKDLSRDGVLDAMKNGRMVMTRGVDAAAFHLAEFFIIDDNSGNNATLGGEVVFSGTPLLCVKGGAQGAPRDVKITIVRDGAVLKEILTKTPFELVVPDEHPLDRKSYYRLEIREGDSLMVTNPIFVRPREKISGQ